MTKDFPGLDRQLDVRGSRQDRSPETCVMASPVRLQDVRDREKSQQLKKEQEPDRYQLPR